MPEYIEAFFSNRLINDFEVVSLALNGAHMWALRNAKASLVILVKTVKTDCRASNKGIGLVRKRKKNCIFVRQLAWKTVLLHASRSMLPDLLVELFP